MSLKAFHVAFVAISTLGALAFAVWCMRYAAAGAGGGYYALAAGSVAAAVALVVYGVWFLKKTKNVSYL